jgi:hypothetical protein
MPADTDRGRAFVFDPKVCPGCVVQMMFFGMFIAVAPVWNGHAARGGVGSEGSSSAEVSDAGSGWSAHVRGHPSASGMLHNAT